MFGMCGNTVELYRYKIEYQEERTRLTEDNIEKSEKILMAEYCISDQHRDYTLQFLNGREYTITKIDQTGNEWIDGMTFDSMEQARAALAMGEDAYKEYLYSQNTELQMAEYLTDLDYRLAMLELGVTE